MLKNERIWNFIVETCPRAILVLETKPLHVLLCASRFEYRFEKLPITEETKRGMGEL